MTDITRAFKEALCGSIEIRPLKNGVKMVVTPFLDWKGNPFQFYVDTSGIVTDGGGIANEMRALGIDQAYFDWPYRDDFLDHYGIREVEGEFVCTDSSDPSAVLAYAQGLSRLASNFEVKASPLENDQFIREVRSAVEEPLVRRINVAPAKRTEAARALLKRRAVSIGSYRQYLDFSPVRERVWVQVIGRERGSPPVQREHVNAKFLPHFLGREERVPHQFVVVLPTLRAYPTEAVKLIKEKADKYICLRDDPHALEQLADVLSLPPGSDRESFF